MRGYDLAEKYLELEVQIAKEKGDFVLFALFLREDAYDRWDLFVSAPWTGNDKRKTVNFLVDEIKSKLGVPLLIYLNHIEVLDPQDPSVQEVNRKLQVEHGILPTGDRTFFGVPIERAYFITSKLAPSPAAA
jgi:hypothetical protein